MSYKVVCIGFLGVQESESDGVVGLRLAKNASVHHRRYTPKIHPLKRNWYYQSLPGSLKCYS